MNSSSNLINFGESTTSHLGLTKLWAIQLLKVAKSKLAGIPAPQQKVVIAPEDEVVTSSPKGPLGEWYMAWWWKPQVDLDTKIVKKSYFCEQKEASSWRFVFLSFHIGTTEFLKVTKSITPQDILTQTLSTWIQISNPWQFDRQRSLEAPFFPGGGPAFFPDDGPATESPATHASGLSPGSLEGEMSVSRDARVKHCFVVKQKKCQ